MGTRSNKEDKVVKRFDMFLDFTDCYNSADAPTIHSEPTEDGAWVRYEDYEMDVVTKVWVLRASTREDECLVGVYSTKERAEAEAATFQAGPEGWHMLITEMTVDQTGKDWWK